MALTRWLVLLVVVAMAVSSCGLLRSSSSAGQVAADDLALCRLLGPVVHPVRMLGPDSTIGDHQTVQRMMALSEPEGSIKADYRTVRALARRATRPGAPWTTSAERRAISNITRWLQACS